MNSLNEIKDDEQPLLFTALPEDQNEQLAANSDEIDNIKDEQSETELLLSKCQVESSSSSAFRCTSIPTRYSIGIWAFIGFYCLYALRVNLSVAIVAMVRKLIVQ